MQRDGSWQKGPPVAVPVTAELDQSVTESAPLFDQEDVRCFPRCTVSLCSILLSTATSDGSRVIPRTQPAFLISLFRFFWSPALTPLPPEHCGKERCTCKRLIKDLQHVAAHITGPGFPQEVESALSFPVNSLCVTFAVQSVCQGEQEEGCVCGGSERLRDAQLGKKNYSCTEVLAGDQKLIFVGNLYQHFVGLI